MIVKLNEVDALVMESLTAFLAGASNRIIAPTGYEFEFTQNGKSRLSRNVAFCAIHNAQRVPGTTHVNLTLDVTTSLTIEPVDGGVKKDYPVPRQFLLSLVDALKLF